MSFIRPELRAAAWRWREALSGAALVLLGLWTLSGTGWFALAAGGVLAVCGAVWAGLGWQRGRFRVDGDGPGVVQVTEGQLSYFGPLTGGMLALDTLTSITLDPSGHPAHLRLATSRGDTLIVPVTAAGAEALLDAFAQLPGFRAEALLRAMAHPGGAAVVIWRRRAEAHAADPPQPTEQGPRRLH